MCNKKTSLRKRKSYTQNNYKFKSKHLTLKEIKNKIKFQRNKNEMMVIFLI